MYLREESAKSGTPKDLAEVGKEIEPPPLWRLQDKKAQFLGDRQRPQETDFSPTSERALVGLVGRGSAILPSAATDFGIRA